MLKKLWMMEVLTPEFIMNRILRKTMNDICARRHQMVAILDVGCGSKPYEDLFTDAQYVGLEVSESGHDHAHSKVDVFYDGSRMPFADSVFDFLICSEVLEHVPDDTSLILECKRVLKPTGELLLSTPFIWQLHEEPYDFRRFTCHGLTRKLDELGFAIKEDRKVGGEVLVALVVAQLALWSISLKYFGKLGLALVSPIVAILNIVSLFFDVSASLSKLYLSNVIVASPSSETG